MTRRHPDEVRGAQRVAYRLPDRFEIPVVGVMFRPDYPKSVHLLADLVSTLQHARRGNDRRDLVKPDFRGVLDVTLTEGAVPIELERDYDNPVDRWAVAVRVPIIECGPIGFVPATTHGRIARPLAEDIDDGGRWEGHITRVRIHPDHPENPGIDVAVQRFDAVRDRFLGPLAGGFIDPWEGDR